MLLQVLGRGSHYDSSHFPPHLSCSHTSWQHWHCLLATRFLGSHGPLHAARGMHARYPPPAVVSSLGQQQAGVRWPELIAGQCIIYLYLSTSQGEAV